MIENMTSTKLDGQQRSTTPQINTSLVNLDFDWIKYNFRHENLHIDPLELLNFAMNKQTIE